MNHDLLRDLSVEGQDLISPKHRVVIRVIGGKTHAENALLARQVLNAINTFIYVETGHLAGIREVE